MDVKTTLNFLASHFKWKILALLIISVLVYGLLFFTFSHDRYFAEKVEIDQTLPLKIFVNNCRFLIDQDANITAPYVFIKAFYIDSTFFNRKPFKSSITKGFIEFYTNAPIQNCLVRLVLPLSQNIPQDIMLYCKGSCILDKTFSDYVYANTLRLEGLNFNVNLNQISLKRLITDVSQLTLVLTDANFDASFIFASTVLIDVEFSLPTDSFSFLCLGSIDYENLSEVEKTTSSIPVDQISPVWKQSQYFMDKIYEYNIKGQVTNNATVKIPFYTPFDIPVVCYQAVSGVCQENAKLIRSNDIFINARIYNDSQAVVAEELSFSQISSIEIKCIPDIKTQINVIFKSYVVTDFFKFPIIRIRFTNLFNANNELVEGAFFANDVQKFLITNFIGRTTSLVSGWQEILTIDLFVMYNQTLFQGNSTNVLRSLYSQISQYINEAQNYESSASLSVANFRSKTGFYFLNVDSEL